MDHSQAVKDMSVERYLLDELTPEARDEFEEHMFECTQCALDIRAGSAFVQEAKAQLRQQPQPAPSPARTEAKRSRAKTDWFAWLRPSFAVPAFAALLLCIGYQNAVTIPGLRTAVNEPRILPVAPLHGATRGAAPTLTTDRAHGLALPVELPIEAGLPSYPSFSLALYSPQGKLVWTGIAQAPHDDQATITLALPGGMLENGTYALEVSGVSDHGDRTSLERMPFQVVLTH